MSKHNPSNVRIKREYLGYLKQAKGRDEATIDAVAKSLARFEESTSWKDFKRFHRGQAVAFKARLIHGHVNVVEGYVEQDGRTVQTKFGKTFPTFFLPVSEEALAIFTDWHQELERNYFWGPTDPLFPATEMALDQDGAFTASGLCRHPWSTTGSARDIFKRAFAAAGLPYYNPHSFRDMLVRHAFALNLSAEQMK